MLRLLERIGRGTATAVAALGALLALGAAETGAQGKPPAPLHLEGSAAPMPWARYKGWNKATWDTYNTLAQRDLTKPAGKEIEIKGSIDGDAKKGKDLSFSRARGGGCLSCHVMGPETLELPGNVGPDLSEIGKQGRTDQWLYNYVYDPRVYNAESSMPPWGAHGLYTEAEIRDIVAFLKSLATPATYKNALDDPTKRPLPVEDRDGLDPFVNPAAERIDPGEKLFAAVGRAGKACATCHGDAKKTFAEWANTMPRWEPRLKRMLGVEEFVYRHARATTGESYLMQSAENTDLSVFLRFVVHGKATRVDTTSAEAKASLERAKVLSTVKVGQLNFACVDCHTPEKGALKWIRGQYLGEPKGQITHFPNWRTSRNEVWDIRKRLQWCNVQVRANELPPDAPEYADLEFYLTVASQGMPWEAPNIRH